MLKIDEIYRWYPVYTKPRFEKKLADNLKKQAIEVYLPLQRTLRQWSDRKKWIEDPLFKSYLFVKISFLEYERIIRTPGLVRFIFFSGRVAHIPDSEMEFLQHYLAGTLTVETTGSFIRIGEKVRIVSGKFKGHEAEMVSYQNQKRLILRLEALGQSVLLNISVADIEQKMELAV